MTTTASPAHCIDRQIRAKHAATIARRFANAWRATERDLYQACRWQEHAAHEAMLARQNMGIEPRT